MHPTMLIPFCAGEEIHVEVVDSHLVIGPHGLAEPHGQIRQVIVRKFEG